ncbi:heat shock 70 kDa protein 9, mitochondrial-like [Triticum dicoccoides]|nr:heat shock 70 kDa protein 9, mitochondrial-like [Triticum dicoccoides]XP_044452757.1 heat shock 70 kDa protein 9, mitochondrial-like isoform X1 [Triticum aestivum]
MVEQIQYKCCVVLKEANITDKRINEIVLTGGMTRVPMIRRIIYDIFGKNQGTSVNHDEAVVIGSAIQAALIVEDQREMREDMIPLSIGVESEGVFMRVIPRHTTIPTKRTVKIPSWCAYGESLHLKVFLGEHVMVSHNTFLGEVELVNNRWSGQGSVHFELTFEVDTDYMVKVTGRNPGDADGARKATFKVFNVREIVMSKGKVGESVRNALLGWSMQGIEIHARLVNMGKHIANTLRDVLSARKDEVPKNIYDDAAKALADLLTVLHAGSKDAAHIHVLKDKMLAAAAEEEKLMTDWNPPSTSRHRGSYSDYSDYEDEEESA